MILSHTHEFIFISNGKTGTTSIEAALAPYQEGEEFERGVEGLYTPKHVPPATLKAQLGAQVWEEYFTFGFVRNPWDWFVSQYFWNWGEPPLSKRKLVKHPVSTLQEYWREKKERKRGRNLDVFSAEDIYDTYDLLRQYRAVYQADSLFQYHYVHDPDGTPLLDFVGRFERITEDFAKAMGHVELDVQLPHRNAASNRDHYRSYYTPETVDLISELYQMDVDAFGYEPPEL
jgi:hypothetical protein